MAYKVYIPQMIHEAGITFLTKRGYQIKRGSGISKGILMREIVDCDAVLARTENYCEDVLHAAKNLKVIARHGIGTDNIDVKAATKMGIKVTNAPMSNMNSVVEHVLCLLLALSRNLIKHNTEIRKGNFTIRNELIGMSLANKTLGIVGLGRIGKLLAKKASVGFSMDVIGYDPYLQNSYDGIEMVTELETVFKRADYISLHLPLTENTRRIIGQNEFKLMKETAFFINTSRGEVVDEKALINALHKGWLKGAGLDVFETEPPTIKNELLSMEHVILTPHNAALTEGALEKMALDAAKGIDEVLSGKNPTWPVNRIKGVNAT